MAQSLENPNAFPQSCTDSGHAPNVAPGMTLRDYFAAKAMQALISNLTFMASMDSVLVKDLPKVSYGYADAMLAERAKRMFKPVQEQS